MVGRHDEKTPRKVHLLGRVASLGEPSRRDDNTVALRRSQGVPDGESFGEGDGIVNQVEEATSELCRFGLELLLRSRDDSSRCSPLGLSECLLSELM